MEETTNIDLPIADFSELIKMADLNERERRALYAFLVKKLGPGGRAAVVHALHVSSVTVQKALAEHNLIANPEKTKEQAPKGRIRRIGGGRKSVTENNPKLIASIKTFAEEHTYGSPEDFVLYADIAVNKLKEFLNKTAEIKISDAALYRILPQIDLTIQNNCKYLHIADSSKTERDDQFRYINTKIRRLQRINIPNITIDCKKKTSLSNFSDNWSEWRAKEEQPGGAIPSDNLINVLTTSSSYSCCAFNEHISLINLGSEQNEDEAAAQSLWQWWNRIGAENFGDKKGLYIICDGSWSKGNKNIIWKMCLAELAERTGLKIHVSHLPHGINRFSKTAHRTFCYICKNLPGKVLVNIESIIGYVASADAKTELRIDCDKESEIYEPGKKISHDKVAKIDIRYITKRPKLNYIISGFKKTT